MIPSTFVGLVLFAASLGPGYVYVRVAEKRRARAERSALVEAVELVVIGGSLSIVSAMAVLTVGNLVTLIDATALGDDPNGYLFDHPARVLSSLAALLALSYFAAARAALHVHRNDEDVFESGVTTWQRMFWWRRPSKKHGTIVLAELRDGRKVAGLLESFTAEHDENRELALAAPIRMQSKKGAVMQPSDDSFVVLREADLLYVSGRYHRPA